MVRRLAAEEVRGARPSSRAQPAPNGGPTDHEAAASAVRALVTDSYRRGSLWARPMTHLLLLGASKRATSERQGAGEGDEGAGGEAGAAGRGVGALRAAASLAVALGKLLWACEEGQVHVVTRGWNAVCVEEDEHAKAVWGTVCVVGEACCLGTEGNGGSGGAGELRRGAGGGTVDAAGGDGGGGVGQRGEDGDMPGRVWMAAYGAWRWLPALASLARRTAAVGYGKLHDMEEPLTVWRPLLVWVQRLCLAQLKRAWGRQGTGPMGGAGKEPGASGATGSDDGGDAGPGPSPKAGSCNFTTAATSSSDRGGGGGGGSSVGAGGGCGCGGGQGCGCWRDFLLHELGAVHLLGVALRRLVPRMLQLSVREEDRATSDADAEALCDVARACVLLAASFPDEVARAAPIPLMPEPGSGGQRTGGSVGSSSSSATAGGPRDDVPWSYINLAYLAQNLQGRGRDLGHPLVRAAFMLSGWWAEECQEAVEPVAFCTETRQWLMMDAEALWRESDFKRGVGLLPPLCELQALLRTCSNPRCAVLPPHGETEEQAEGRGRLEGGGGSWYCCRECREEHWGAGHSGQCCGAGGVAFSPR